MFTMWPILAYRYDSQKGNKLTIYDYSAKLT